MTRLDAVVAPSPTPELEPPAALLLSAHDEYPADEWPDDLLSVPPPNLESDEPPLESDLHREQIDLLIRLLK